MRDFVMSATRDFSKNIGAFSLLKYYPIAFLVAHDLSSYRDLCSLHEFNRLTSDDKRRIPIDLRHMQEPHFPENSPSGISFGRAGGDFVHSVPKPKKRKN